MAIKKNDFLPFLTKFENIQLAPGIFISTILATINKAIFLDKEKLTFYRIHPSTSNPPLSKNDFFNNRQVFYKTSLESLEKITHYVTYNNDALDFANIFLLLTRLNYYIFSDNSNLSRKDLIKYFISFNKSKDFLRISEIISFNIIFILALIFPKKILKHMMYLYTILSYYYNSRSVI